jgi:hypothetical protein
MGKPREDEPKKAAWGRTIDLSWYGHDVRYRLLLSLRFASELYRRLGKGIASFMVCHAEAYATHTFVIPEGSIDLPDWAELGQTVIVNDLPCPLHVTIELGSSIVIGSDREDLKDEAMRIWEEVSRGS